MVVVVCVPFPPPQLTRQRASAITPKMVEQRLVILPRSPIPTTKNPNTIPSDQEGKSPGTQTGNRNSKGTCSGGIDGESGGHRRAVGSNAGRRESTARRSRQSAAGKSDGRTHAIDRVDGNGKCGRLSCFDGCAGRRSVHGEISIGIAHDQGCCCGAGSQDCVTRIFRANSV